MKEIRRIIRFYDELKAENTPCALAVVVDVKQSSYRRIGARLLVAEDGRFVGGISGGCLEGDALQRAKSAIQLGRPVARTYDTTEGEDATIGIGLGCEGRIEVAFIPMDFTEQWNEIELLRSVVDTRIPRVMLRHLDTVLMSGEPQFEVSLFQPEADRFTLYLPFEPAIPHQFHGESLNALAKGRSSVKTIRGERGFPHRVLFEVLHPRPRLILTGYNYDIPAALRAAKLLDWEVWVVAPLRKMTKEITSLADRVLDYGQVKEVPVDEATAVVLMSHDYEWDRKMVQHFLPLKPIYLGMLGPRKRMLKMDESLPDLELAAYPNLYAPVGLDVGAETPEEIAAALISEIIMVLRGRSGGALRERGGPIHENA
ncbi:XdhC family protein [Lewinella sp. 4G2]|uniref:XdhC family protein n=1 Tax=Lewinella sp. 4G2 TaxID=1803372 RepID=UPI0007B4F047|nr:XdhC family protein [Lewinella sp. 4G2]OAV46092.1 hypothetical protein A3850_017670 [Lewinella sp. 4G2]